MVVETLKITYEKLNNGNINFVTVVKVTAILTKNLHNTLEGIEEDIREVA